MVNSLLYILATLGANYTAAWFVPLPVFGHISVGTLIFGVTFVQRDLVHHKGRRWVYGTIAVACAANVLMSAMLGVPARIIVASFVAIALADMVDTEIYESLKCRSWMARVATSNAVSGVLQPGVFVSLLFGEILVKWGIAFVVSLPYTRTPVTPP
jgi:uncharacterized PurR-regulated membrane protein YhhQ (DUF165 family)